RGEGVGVAGRGRRSGGARAPVVLGGDDQGTFLEAAQHLHEAPIGDPEANARRHGLPVGAGHENQAGASGSLLGPCTTIRLCRGRGATRGGRRCVARGASLAPPAPFSGARSRAGSHRGARGAPSAARGGGRATGGTARRRTRGGPAAAPLLEALGTEAER